MYRTKSFVIPKKLKLFALGNIDFSVLKTTIHKKLH